MDRQLVSSGSPFESAIGFSRALRVGPHVFVSGTAPIWPDGSCDPDPAVQTRRCLEIILAALAEAGAAAADVVRTRMFLLDPADAGAVGEVHGEVFGAVRPAATMLAVAALLDPRWKVEIEAEDLAEVHGEVFGAVRPAATMLAVAALLDPRWKVEIEAEALIATT